MFEVGDKVRCVEPLGALLVKGHVYEVEKVETEEDGFMWLFLNGVKNDPAGWKYTRFEAVEP